ncbi:hypothetical protein Desde_2680 [Desulfitobacterium dehalogenans ATCC 51507]|uniref:Outer membrane lipoprotein-sorting protein n=1 Tax=Desulfitobacterium dehalogenans (strain ATCC 51507 / DSM 9161 / JW/IU-DC1) TaxID=756499 RepID=I4AAK9_DESDJ|nr:hypothetical protein Desde_2680 [Desulfitobacterium dehalogenans ATCC 51507]
MRRKLFWVILICILFFTAGCAKSTDLNDLINMSRDIQEFYYEERNSEGIVFDGKVWAKDNQFKREVTIYSDNVAVDTIGYIRDGSGKMTKYKVLSKNTSAAVATGMIGKFEGIRGNSFLRYIDMIDPKSAEIVGTEKVEGRQSVIIKTNIANRVDPSKIWIDKKTGVPTKIEFVENEKILTTLTYKNVKIGPGSVSDKKFSVPKSAIILEE